LVERTNRTDPAARPSVPTGTETEPGPNGR